MTLEPQSSEIRKNQQPLNIIVATDCGSTTTKAILIEKVGDEYRQTHRGEAPTTVEAPFEDVTRGVLNAIAEIEELSGRTILDGDRIITPNQAAQGNPQTGVDIYVSTSSAGGGLQMMVTGVVQNMTGESAQRAALGAGAIVIDVLASNDGGWMGRYEDGLGQRRAEGAAPEFIQSHALAEHRLRGGHPQTQHGASSQRPDFRFEPRPAGGDFRGRWFLVLASFALRLPFEVFDGVGNIDISADDAGLFQRPVE